MKKTLHFALFFILVLTVGLLFGGCGSSPSDTPVTESPAKDGVIQIGMSFDTFVLERWIRDRDIFVSTAADLGAEVNVQNANGDAEEQAAQIEYLIDKNVSVLVIISIDTESQQLLSAIRKAQDKGIKVISYDRAILNAQVDLHVSFDNEKVGKLMAEAVLSQIDPEGKIAVLYGSPTDNNVSMVEEGIKKVLAQKNIVPVYEGYSENWKAEYAYQQMNQCLETVGPVNGVICGNDGLAAMAFRSLSEHRMASDVCVVGQDADIDACQRIVEGTQYMTVYKSIDDLARQTAQYAVKLARDEPLDLTDTFFDGTAHVPFLKLEPVAVTAENMDDEIIDSRFHLRSEVYLNVNQETQQTKEMESTDV